MMSICLTWFPVGGLGKPKLYQNMWCFTRIGEGCGGSVWVINIYTSLDYGYGWWTGTMQRTEMCIRFLIHHPFDYDPLVYPSLIWNRVKILYSNRVILYCNKWRLKFPLFFLCICFWKIGNYNINTDSLGKNFSSVLYRVIIVTVSDLFGSLFSNKKVQIRSVSQI